MGAGPTWTPETEDLAHGCAGASGRFTFEILSKGGGLVTCIPEGPWITI